MAVKKITRRWLFNSFGVIVFIIVFIEVAVSIGISNYYYSSVREQLLSRADSVNDVFKQYAEDPTAEFTGLMRNYVASFSLRDRMELMTIDAHGEITLTSSGFMPEPEDLQNLTDYQTAVSSPERSGRFIGKMNNQRVMAVSVLFPVEGQEALSAVRFVVGLSGVDRQIQIWITALVLLGLFILMFVLFTSSFFISSIVNPIGEVGETARKIAQGNFSARLNKKTDDEIGELCDIINYMASELATAEKLKNDFISSVSHELRTPLTAIQGWGETLLSDDGEDKTMLHKGMNVIISETNRLSQMVEELLDFSRMQSGRLKLVLAKIDVLAELSEAVLMYTERARREGIDMLFEDDGKAAPVLGDKNKLRQVFVNIIDNGIKYSDAGGSLQITTRLLPTSVCMVFADTGIGIAPEDLLRVKTKFFKANSTRRGSGIGLAVADEIITRHGGSLEVTSELGKGTTVTVTLPLYVKQDDAVLLQE